MRKEGFAEAGCRGGGLDCEHQDFADLDQNSVLCFLIGKSHTQMNTLKPLPTFGMFRFLSRSTPGAWNIPEETNTR